MKSPTYQYRAQVKRIYDGDTIYCDIDLGLRTWAHDIPLRLLRINAPEAKGPERPQGEMAREWLRGQVEGKEVIITTERDPGDKYGRWLAEIYLDGTNINDAIVAAGHAAYKDFT